MDPPGHTARYWPSRISTDQPAVQTERKCPPGSICSPHVPNDHTKTHHHRLTDSVPASPHPVRLMAAVLQRPEVPSPLPDCLPRRPVVAVQSGKALSPEEHLGCTHSPTMSLWTRYTSHGYRNSYSASGHSTVLSEFSLNNVDSWESPDTPDCPRSRSVPGDDPLFCSE